MTSTEGVRDWLRGCPDIVSGQFFTVDYLNDDPNCYAINTSPSAINYTRDILGETYISPEQTVNYYFTASFPYTLDVQQNLANLQALERVSTWMYAQSAAKNFPTIAEGRVLSILPTLTPFPVVQGSGRAVYRVSIQLKYRRY